MLGACTHPCLLYATHQRGGRKAREQGIFGEILKVSATERIALYIHARAQHHIHSASLGLVAIGLAHALQHIAVP